MIIRMTATATTVEHDQGQVHAFDKRNDAKTIAAMVKTRVGLAKARIAPKKEE